MHNVLCIDLDGTLVHTDILQEAILLFIKVNPWRLMLVFFWLIRGRAILKQKIAQRVDLEVNSLPYNQALLAWIKAEKEKGRKVVLVTATDKKFADMVANYLGIFDDVLASDGKINLRANYKAAELNRRYGEKNYDYAGNSKPDLAVWKNVKQAIIVNGSSTLIKRAKKIANIDKIFPRQSLTLKSLVKALRVHQYPKNILIFTPLFAGHLLFNLSLLLTTILGFVSFCCIASSVYLLNDLLDLSSDRKHPHKSKRAIASGFLPISTAIYMMIALFILAGVFSWSLSINFKLTLLGYYIITLLYSFSLKKIVLIDVISLSFLYTIRIIAGMSLLVMYPYSLWMLLFAMFLFLSLAFLKRVSELSLFEKHGQQQIAGRSYLITDLLTLNMFGISSGFLAILVLALYLNSSEAAIMYKNPQVLLLLFPFILYWLCRIWLLATQGKIHDDPVMFTIKDKVSYYIMGIIFFILFIATV